MIKLRSVQELFIKKAEEFRKKGVKKALLLLPTGLGKTLASLYDALNYVKKYEKRTGKKGKILVLAHNYNLLYQHASDFKLLCKNRKIGFLYKSKKETNAEVLFANIMTIKQKKYLNSFKPDEFVYIIIDETHHAGAKSYQCIFEYFKPEFLLGMTATPNRTDQKDIFRLYNNNVILNISRSEAINKNWLRKIKYVFLYDKWCNYDKVKGYMTKEGFYKYHVKELGKKYSIPERDKAIVDWFKNRAKDRQGIGFCIGVEESKRMAQLFVDNGISAAAIYGVMKEDKRDKIIEDYKKGKYQVVFNCDLIGEGLHFPKVDIILKLRPTQSYIKNNQQTGRGLINIEGVDMSQFKYKKLLIFDLVGNYKKSYYNYIYQGTKNNYKNKKINDIREIIELPIGCEVEFDPQVIDLFNQEYKHDFENQRVYYTKNDLIKIYNDVKEKIGRNPFPQDMQSYGAPSPNVYIKYFGVSWLEFKQLVDNKLKIIKDDELKKVEDKEERNKMILETYERLKLSNTKPSQRNIEKELKRNGCDVSHTTIATVLKEAGYNGYGNREGMLKQRKEEIIKKNLLFKQKYGFIPLMHKHKSALIRKYNKLGSQGDIIKIFGSYSNYFKSVGYERKIVPYKKYTKEKALEDYYKIREKLGRIPRFEEINSKEANLPRTFDHAMRKFFNKTSYIAFLKEIGELKEGEISLKKISKESIIKIFEEFKERKGYVPTYKELNKYKKGIGSHIINRYGNYKDFLKENGYSIEEINKLKVSGKINEIKRFEITKKLKEIKKEKLEIRNEFGHKLKEVKDKEKRNQMIKDIYEKLKLINTKLINKKVSCRSVAEELRSMGCKLSQGTIADILKGKRYYSKRKDCEHSYIFQEKKKKRNELIIETYEKLKLSNTKPSYRNVEKELKRNGCDVGRSTIGTEMKNNFGYNVSYMTIGRILKEAKVSHVTIGKVLKEKQSNNIEIISNYKPKTLTLPITKRESKGITGEYNWGSHHFKTGKEKVDIRKKIIENIQDGDNVLLLESPELSAIKEIEKQGKKPQKIVIPNNSEFKKIAKALADYKTDLKIKLINTSVLQYLTDSNEKFDFMWLDYCGAFSYYMRDLDILFAKHINSIKLILTYNLFDPKKDDDTYYFARVIDYVLEKVGSRNKVRLIKDISYRYKKCMYNIGFDIRDNQLQIVEVKNS